VFAVISLQPLKSDGVCLLPVDTVMMMSSYSDSVVIRHPQPGAVAVCVSAVR